MANASLRSVAGLCRTYGARIFFERIPSPYGSGLGLSRAYGAGLGVGCDFELVWLA